jgi:hypothetical protein
VVEAQHAGVPQVVPERVDEVAVAGRAQRTRVEGPEAPVLAAGEERVRRRAGGDALGEQLAEPPAVVAVGVHAERHVEVERARRRRAAARVRAAVRLPLREEVVVAVLGREVAVADGAVAQALRPCVPALAATVADGAEAA